MNYPSGGTPIDTNGLYLEITNVANGWSYLNLRNATNQVYSIWSTTNLAIPFSGWNVEMELWPTVDQTNIMPFNVQNFERTPLFIHAEDWTGIDSNGDGIPDWWIWKYFGDLSETSTNLDSQGNTLGYDYTNSLDPDVISFSIESTNDYVNTTTAHAQLNVTAGQPSYYAVLVNNQTTTNWLPFVSTNLTVSLGSTDGVYNVEVGLKGLPADAAQTWESYSFTLDTVAPLVTITNPVGSTVTKPYLQLQGFANEQLSSLSYDISNAFGLATNLDAFVTDQGFDTNKLDFTTNYFQAYDVPLATNNNYITLRVTDRAGNTTTTNFNVTLDYSTATNPPSVGLIWPQEGMLVSGTNITLRGTMSDETGTIQATVVNGDGTTKVIAGIVERNRNFWIENVPLNGTNQISLQATDAAGNVTTTNFTVNPSTIQLTIDSTPSGDDLYQATGSVCGHISDATATVFVNGVQGTNNGDGTWSAANVPILGVGTATFSAAALPSGGAPPTSSSTDTELPAKLIISKYHFSLQELETDAVSGDWVATSTIKDYTGQISPNSSGEWAKTYQGTLNIDADGTFPGCFYYEHYQWSDTNAGTEQSDSASYGGYSGPVPAGDIDESMSQQISTFNSGSISSYEAKGMVYMWDYVNYPYKATIVAHTEMKLYTGGKSAVSRKNLFCLNCGATEYSEPSEEMAAHLGHPEWWTVNSKAIASGSIQVGNLGSPGSDGNLWVALPDNSSGIDVNIKASATHYNAEVTQQKYKTYVSANDAPLDPVAIIVTNCVGQKIIFKLAFDPALPGGVLVTNQNNWVLPSEYVNAYEWFQPGIGSDLTIPCDGTYYLTTCDPALTNYSHTASSIDSPFYTFYQQASWPLTQPETGAWWVSGGPKAVTCFPALTLTNGQKVSLGSVQGNFLVVKPHITRVDTSNGPYGSQLQTNSLPYTLWLNGGPMKFDVYISKTFPGKFGISQLVSMYSETIVVPPDVFIWTSTSGNYYLDKAQEFYETEKNMTNLVSYPSNDEFEQGSRIEDTPGQSLGIIEADYTGHWKDYVRFTPSGSDSIPITLGRIDWNLAATALATPHWHITSDPSGVDGPILHADDDSFPTWINSFPNGD